jgi:hypothetical protein
MERGPGAAGRYSKVPLQELLDERAVAVFPVAQCDEFDFHSDVQLNMEPSPVLELNFNLVGIRIVGENDALNHFASNVFDKRMGH